MMKRKMTLRKFIIIYFGFLLCFNAGAQLSVNNSYTAQQLVQDVLLGGGVTVSNVSYSGSYSSIGKFTGGGSTNLGLGSGIVMSTGWVNGSVPLGSAVNGFASDDMSGSGDPDLEALVNGANSSYDATILEFDFVPLSDTVKFRYVFASEEYPEYVCSPYNDVFGFFISGPGITGPYSNSSINVAKIPNTSLPVAINSINNGTPGGTYVATDCITLSYSNYYIDNDAMFGTTIVFDGFTTVLTAWCVVQPCQQYHIKLAVGDLGDGIYDSAVFLEAGSFSSTTITLEGVTTNTAVANDSTAIEGCSGTIITFTRTGSSVASSMTVPITVTGTATNGIDYVGLPASVTFPAGQSTTTLTIDPFTDGVSETDETIIVSVPQVTACTSYEPTITVTLKDPVPILVRLPDDTMVVCPQTFNIDAVASGGNGILSYLWGNGLGTNPSIEVSPFSTTTYTITVTDACGQEATEDVTITMPTYNPVQITTSPDPTICSGETTTLTVSANGGMGNYSYQWSHGLGTDQTVNVSPAQTTTYTISVSDSCGIVSTANITVNIMPIVADFTYTYSANEILNFHDASVNGINFQWDFGDGEQSTEQNPTHIYADTGLYVVTFIVTNSIGCIDTVQKEVIVYPPFHLYVPNCFTPDDNGLNDYFIPVAVGVTSSEMEIYDRWGSLLYYSTEEIPSWNGRDSHNERVQVGVYVYLLHYVTPTGLTYKSTGTVTLLR